MTAPERPDGQRQRFSLIGPGQVATPDPSSFGTKAANLMLLARAGLPVPAAFVLGTEICAEYLEEARLPPDTADLVARGLRYLEESTGRSFGDPRRPLLVSVRSGAPASMPGMLETVLDIGLSQSTRPGLLRRSGDPTFVWNSYLRLVRSYAEVVTGLPPGPFAAAVERMLERQEVPTASELDVRSLRELAAEFEVLYRSLAATSFPQDPMEQLRGAIEAVLRSWSAERAVDYRRLEGLGDLRGTAVTVQVMVFGNVGVTSGSGVGFTRDPATGRDELYVDFVLDAQGDDVVAGRDTTGDPSSSITAVPGLGPELERIRHRLEDIFGDVQDFEFTVEDGRLWLLQTRTAARTPLAALQIACDLEEAGRLDPATALGRLEPYRLEDITRTVLAVDPGMEPLAHAVSASSGVASGTVCLDDAAALEAAERGSPCILVRPHASTDDISALAVCQGLLTATGARTSHAAVVARQLGVVCLVGCRDLTIDLESRRLSLGPHRLAEGDDLTLDATSGQIYPGALSPHQERPDELLDRVRGWRATVAGR